MSGFLFETLAWTGALIALVLLVRRPVARQFGPQAAYALWLLPMLRLVMPPITLPGWLAPDTATATASTGASAPVAPAVPESFAAAATGGADPALWQTASTSAAVPLERAATGPELFAWLDRLPLVEALMTLWLVGAGVFLWRRFAAYFALRRELLEGGREVGAVRMRLARVRLIETPGTAAPLAFGVIDPVIAMPQGFMALPDRRKRDLALAHEIAHHQGFDLVVNVLVQPLFALHWWNTLGHYGWLALRRDQEAACDARVIDRRSAEERAAYAGLIASFAAQPRLVPHAAITAPMACPVLGDKSIIQRLRSLSMSPSTYRRRAAGRALLGAAVLALPLTGTISYAAAETQVGAAEQPPEPPAPPAPALAPDAPLPPQAPEPPAAPEPILAIDPDAPEGDEKAEVIERVTRGADGEEKRVRMVFRRPPDGPARSAEARARAEHHRAEYDRMRAEHDRMLAEVRAELAKADRELADMPHVIKQAMAEARAAHAAAAAVPQVIVKRDCRENGAEMVESTSGKDGTQRLVICERRVLASARNGLQEARDDIAANRDIPEDTRKRILNELDQAIARWSEKEG